MMPLERLTEIEKEIKNLETEKRSIYLASISAPDEEKVIEDYYANILCKENPFPKLEMPFTVNGIISEGDVVAPGVPSFLKAVVEDPSLSQKDKEGMAAMFGSRKPGSWVAIRPCAKECENKTYLGLLLGDIALSFGIKYNTRDGVMCVYPSGHNPAIFVFALGKIVFGAESWWGPIKSPDDMKKITDQDIDNVWYVQALKAMSGGNTGPKESEKGANIPLDNVENGWVQEAMEHVSVIRSNDGSSSVSVDGMPREAVRFTVPDELFAHACKKAITGLVERAIRRAESNRPSIADVTGYRVDVYHGLDAPEGKLSLRFDHPSSDEDRELICLTMDEESLKSIVSLSQSRLENKGSAT